jgi:tetratricopeptide (TPR) repeat protein
MAQEINVESLLKKADDAAKLADKYPKDGLKQIYAADALTNIALNEKRDFDRAQTYTSRALDIAKKQKVLKDTLLAKTYFQMANTNMVLASYAIACDYYEMAIDAAEKELGRYSPYTIFTRMMAGRAIMMVDPDLRHGFIHLTQAFYDNESAPGGKPITNMDQLNCYYSFAMEQMIAAFTNSQRFGVPVVLKDQKPCLMIQSRDWHVGQPLINWMAPNMLRSQQDREAHAGEDIIILEDDNFRALTKEEGKNIRFDFPACYLKGHELSVGPGSFIWYLNPEAYNKIVQDYEAFKKNGKK